MTPRLVQRLLKVIGRSELIGFYNQILSYKAAGNQKLPSLEEFLALASGKDQEAPISSFDEDTDKILEAQALKRLAERQRHNGQ